MSDLTDALQETTDLVMSFCRQYRNDSAPDFGYQKQPNNYFPAAGPALRSTKKIYPGMGREVADAAFWLRIVGPLAYVCDYGDYQPEKRKTLMWSCRLLGLTWGDVHKAINDCRFYGDAESALGWARYMRPVDERYVGFIYSARAVGEPSVTKIGFSTRPEKRMKELSRIYGVEICLVRALPGTILHEWALHQNTPLSVASEWYRTSAVPSWLADGMAVAEAA